MKKQLFILLLSFVFAFSYIDIYAYNYGFVNCNALNVRVSPNTNCEIVTTLSRGANVEIVYTDNGWHNIRMQNGTTGFVYADYITDSSGTSTNADITAKIVSDAHKYIGSRYVYGQSGPNAFDCSGFTSYIFKQNGYSLPRTSTSQGSFGSYVEKANLIPGDLVFFSNRRDRKINHVGIYVGNDAFIHASTSTRGVVVDSLNSDYYTNHYICARRVV